MKLVGSDFFKILSLENEKSIRLALISSSLYKKRCSDLTFSLESNQQIGAAALTALQQHALLYERTSTSVCKFFCSRICSCENSKFLARCLTVNQPIEPIHKCDRKQLLIFHDI